MLPVRKPRFSASDLILGLKQSVTGSVHLLCFNKTRKSIPSTELSHKECPVHLASRRNHSWAGPSTQTPPPLPTIPGSDTKPFLSAERGFHGGSVGKNPPASAGDKSSIPGWGRPPEEGVAAHSSLLAWRIPWTEEPGGLQSTGSQSWAGLSDSTPLQRGLSRSVANPCLCARPWSLHWDSSLAL